MTLIIIHPLVALLEDYLPTMLLLLSTEARMTHRMCQLQEVHPLLLVVEHLEHLLQEVIKMYTLDEGDIKEATLHQVQEIQAEVHTRTL